MKFSLDIVETPRLAHGHPRWKVFEKVLISHVDPVPVGIGSVVPTQEAA
jgi:hypothetical protein